ncbi:hypothetical protein ARMGADRAFT_1105242 [Armillaria gallica]|uniref:Uncharacterized protein n=1 Tax=Armillaria gallica TaxID=47427 RepID=A0A2H3DCC4_ARMGA|nr:hypothetical protein ARMGADRAFT_1105242 [Armillaria gallica]
MGYLRPKAKPIAPTVSDLLLVKQAASTTITTAPLPGPIPSADPSVIIDPVWIDYQRNPIDHLEALIHPLTTMAILRSSINNDLAVFDGDPMLLDDPAIAAVDLWEEVLNGVMHCAFWGKATALEDYKHLVWQIGNSHYENIEHLVCVALSQGWGIRGILEMYEAAARGIYQPKSFTEEEMLAMLFWWLGRVQLAEIAHRALNLPGMSTIWDSSKVEKNIASCLESIRPILESLRDLSQHVVHMVLMLDEIATNYFLGVSSLEFCSGDDMDELFRGIDDGDIHYASEATVGALCLLTDDKRLNKSAREHAYIIQTVMDAIHSEPSCSNLRTVSIASDGETKCGSSLINLTFQQELSSQSPLYAHVLPVKLLMKSLLIILLWDRGVTVLDAHITPAVIKAYLRAEGSSETHICYLFKPSDKQDVKLTYDLLKDMWCLSEMLSDKPGFASAQNAIRSLGQLCWYLLLPYICVDFSLSKQLQHLSAAAHRNLVLFCAAKKHFFPTLLYSDIMIMIKNTYLCVAKGKVDNLDRFFYLILLETDGLEKLFGILRTMVGNDANVDMLQLSTRLAGMTEVSNILAKYPQWDRGPHCLQLPALTQNLSPVPLNEDHLTPSSWRGDLSL